eukprot:g42018.t1
MKSRDPFKKPHSCLIEIMEIFCILLLFAFSFTGRNASYSHIVQIPLMSRKENASPICRGEDTSWMASMTGLAEDMATCIVNRCQRTNLCYACHDWQ